MASAAEPTRLTRRALLLGAGGAAGAAMVVAACGPSGRSTNAGSSTSAGGGLSLVPRFAPDGFVVAATSNRMVFSIVKTNGDTLADSPASLEFRFERDGAPDSDLVAVAMHADGVPLPYYPARFTPSQPGIYSAVVTVNGVRLDQRFSAGAPGSSKVPGIGNAVPLANTPTDTDHRGVDPICTRSPSPCALHTVDLRDALASSTPTALLVSTPAYCQIGVCGPVLDLVLQSRDRYPGVQFIHAEVYRAPKSNPANPAAGGVAPVVEALGLDYEPAMFFIGRDGKVVDRLDNVFDRTEISAGLDKLAVS